MTYILGISGSPVKDSSTDTLVKEVLKKDAILNWAQGFLDIRKELLG